MITIETQVTGGQIGRQLAYDPEEFAYALEAIAEDACGDLADEVAGYPVDREKVVAFLRKLLDALETAE